MKKDLKSNKTISMGKFSFSGPTGNHLSTSIQSSIKLSKMHKFKTEVKDGENEVERDKEGDDSYKKEIFKNEEEESLLIESIKESRDHFDSVKTFDFGKKILENEHLKNKEEKQMPVKSNIGILGIAENKNLNFQKKKKKGLSMKGVMPQDRLQVQSYKDNNPNYKIWKSDKKQKDSRSQQIKGILNKYNSKKRLNKKEKTNRTRKNSKRQMSKKSSKRKINMRMDMSNNKTKHKQILTFGSEENFKSNNLMMKPEQKKSKNMLPQTIVKNTEEESDILLYESKDDSAFKMSSTMDLQTNQKLLGFHGNFISKGNPFVKKKSSKLNNGNFNEGKLAKKLSYKSFHSSNLELIDKSGIKMIEPNIAITQKKFHSSRNTILMHELPLEGIYTDQSVVVNDEASKKINLDMFRNESELLATQTKIASDEKMEDHKVKQKFSINLKIKNKEDPNTDSVNKVRKSLQTIDLDEKEIRSSIKFKTQRKLSKFKILDKAMSRSNDSNMLGQIPPLEEEQSQSDLEKSKLKKTYTIDQKLAVKQPLDNLNKSQSMDFNEKKKKYRISINKNVIIEVSKESSPKNDMRGPSNENLTSEFKGDDLDINKMNYLLSNNNLGTYPNQLSQTKRSNEHQIPSEKINNISIDLSKEEVERIPQKNELIYKTYPTESDLLTQDEVFMNVEINNKTPSLNVTSNGNENMKQEEVESEHKQIKTISKKRMTIKIKSKEEIKKQETLESENHIEFSNAQKIDKKEKNSKKLLKQKNLNNLMFSQKFENIDSINNSMDKIYRISDNNGTKKITFSTDKNKMESNKNILTNSNKFFKKDNEKKAKNLSDSHTDNYQSINIIKSLRSMSIPNNRKPKMSRFRCTAPSKGRSLSLNLMFKSFHQNQKNKKEIDKEFMETWISSGIKTAIVKLKKKHSLPSHLIHRNSNISYKEQFFPTRNQNPLKRKSDKPRLEYAYGKCSKSQIDGRSIKSLSNSYGNHSEMISAFPIKKKYSLKETFPQRNVYYPYERRSLNPQQEYIPNSSEYQMRSLKQIIPKRKLQSSSMRNVKGQKETLFKKRSSKKVISNLQFKEDMDNFSRNKHKEIKPQKFNKSFEAPNDIYEYEFTINKENQFSNKPTQRDSAKEYFFNINNIHSGITDLNLNCSKHKRGATHVCIDCDRKKCLKCEKCVDIEQHKHISLAQLTNVERLQSLSEKKSINSFTLFDRLEKEFKLIREQLLKGLESMIVNYKKAILENSKEFLLKSLAFKAKRTQEDLFGDPKNMTILKKLAKQVNDLSRLQNAPFIEKASITTNILIKSAVSFHKDLQLLMHTYSVTSGVVTPRIKDISKSFRRNLSEMISKIDKENKSKKLKILKSRKSSKARSKRKGKSKVKKSRNISLKRKGIKNSSRSNSKKKRTNHKKTTSMSQMSKLKSDTQKSNVIKKEIIKMTKSTESNDLFFMSDPSQIQIKISTLENFRENKNLSKNGSIPKDKKIKLYKKSQISGMSSKEYSLDKATRSISHKRTKSKNLKSGKRSRKASKKKKNLDYYKLGKNNLTNRSKKMKKNLRIEISADDRTSLSERSASKPKLRNKKGKKKKNLVYKKTPVMKHGALENFIKKTNKFISQNRLAGDISLKNSNSTKNDKMIIANEYDFDKIQYSTMKKTKNSPKIYKTGSGKKGPLVVMNRLSYRKSTSRKPARKNPKRMLNLVRLSSSHYSHNKIDQNINKSQKRKAKKSKSRDISIKKKIQNYKKAMYQTTVSNIKELKKKHKDSSIYKPKTRPLIQVDSNFQSHEKYQGALDDNKTKKNYASDINLRLKLSSKKKSRVKNKDGTFRLIYSIPELNKEVLRKKSSKIKIKHKKIILDRKPLGFTMRNGLNNNYFGNDSMLRNISNSKKNSKSQREYMGNFY
jgi:hypothetical protein